MRNGSHWTRCHPPDPSADILSVKGRLPEPAKTARTSSPISAACYRMAAGEVPAPRREDFVRCACVGGIHARGQSVPGMQTALE